MKSTEGSAEGLARRVLEAVRPGEPAGRYEQLLPLPVPVRGRAAPDGVPLEEILGAARKASSTVEGLMVRGERITVVHSTEPDAGQRKRLDHLFGDRDGLLALGRTERRVAETDGGLRGVLLDEKTPDAEWLKAFRRWAVAELLTGQGDR
jgi:hypothetical protein